MNINDDDDELINSEHLYNSNIHGCDNGIDNDESFLERNHDSFSENGFVSFQQYGNRNNDEDLKLLLASTHILEATKGRNGYFIPRMKELRYYAWYNHKAVRFLLFVSIVVNLSLVFFEAPAVPLLALPYWCTMSIEFVCIIGYCFRLYHAMKFMPPKRQYKDKKIVIVFVCILVTLIDMAVTIILKIIGIEKYAIRWSRILRPAFLINFSESRQVRRTVRNIRKTIPEIVNVLFLFLLVIALYALLGAKLFENRNFYNIDGTPYFTNYWDNYFALYVLTTTANNPDVMIPAYNRSNWYSLFFVIFTLICMYIFVSIFLAVVYKNYRTHLKNEVKVSVYRKRRNMKAAFDCLKERKNNKFVVTFERWKRLMIYMKPNMNPMQVILYWRVMDEREERAIEFKNFLNFCELLHIKMDVFDIRGHIFAKWLPSFYFSKIGKTLTACVQHRYFIYFFDLVIIVNAFCVALNEEKSEIAFLILFNAEIFLKLFTYGPRAFISKLWNVFDSFVIGAATLTYILEALFQILRYDQFILDFLLILRVLRLFKIIGSIKRFQVIINTILQIGPAILTYGGILFVLYYVYAIVGMELFNGLIKDYPSRRYDKLSPLEKICGNTRLNGTEFVRFRYCEKNFNNIAKSYMILFDLMVVNQWHILTDGVVAVTSKYSRLYFFSFHMICVIVVLNIFVAFILEAFMLQYSLSKGKFEANFDKQLHQKGRAHSALQNGSNNFVVDCSIHRLDTDFEINDYLKNSGLTFKLRETNTKNAEFLLQQMFEDELDDKDLGPEFDEFEDDLEEIVEQKEEIRVPRKLTMRNIDFV